MKREWHALRCRPAAERSSTATPALQLLGPARLTSGWPLLDLLARCRYVAPAYLAGARLQVSSCGTRDGVGDPFLTVIESPSNGVFTCKA